MANGAPLTWAFHTEITGLLGLIIILIYALLTKKHWNTPGYTYCIWSMVGMVLFFMIIGLCISELGWYIKGHYEYGPFYPVPHFVSSFLLVFFKLFLLVLTFICLIIYRPFFLQEKGKWEYGILLLIMVLAMLILISTIDLFIGFLAIEIQTITLYVMLGLKRYSNLSMEAAQKFFFFAGFSSSCLGFAFSLFFSLVGQSNIYLLGELFSFLPPVFISFTIILASLFYLFNLLFKLTLIPFHFWVGDIFQGTHGYFNSYLVIVSKLPIILFLAKVYFWMLVYITPYFYVVLTSISLASIVIGSIYSLTEVDFKRFWALSSIVNMGYIVLAMAVGSAMGLAVALVYMFLYLLNTVFIWIIAIHLVKNPASSFAFNEFLTKIIKWSTLSQNKLSLGVFVGLVLLSLAGLPPGAGFLPKAWLFYHFLTSNYLVLLFVVFLFSFVSMAYYIRMGRFIFFPTDQAQLESFERLSSFYTWILIVVFFLNLFTIIFFFGLTDDLVKMCEVFINVV
jgi:NADH-quinone oxidoreductase subunit N